MGNITTLFGLGKRYIFRNDITNWKFCKDYGLKVFSSNGDFDDLFEELDESIRSTNIINVKSNFSEEKLTRDLKNIFNLKKTWRFKKWVFIIGKN